MGFITNGQSENSENIELSQALFDTLSVKDYAAAWLIAEDLSKFYCGVSTRFNRAVCFFSLGEYEKALDELKKAEDSVRKSALSENHDKKMFLKAISFCGEDELIFVPMHKAAANSSSDYAFYRIIRLKAECLIRLNRVTEAATQTKILRDRYGLKCPENKEN